CVGHSQFILQHQPIFARKETALCCRVEPCKRRARYLLALGAYLRQHLRRKIGHEVARKIGVTRESDPCNMGVQCLRNRKSIVTNLIVGLFALQIENNILVHGIAPNSGARLTRRSLHASNSRHQLSLQGLSYALFQVFRAATATERAASPTASAALFIASLASIAPCFTAAASDFAAVSAAAFA